MSRSPRSSAMKASTSRAARSRSIAKTYASRARTGVGSRPERLPVTRPDAPKKPARKADARQLVLVTGLSGSGKGSVLKTFEDLGYYCVDNLPVALIPTFTELYEEGRGEIERAALLVDAREGEQIEKLPGLYRKLSSEHPATLVFVEANDEALLRRFSETRRPHPLGHGASISEGIRAERRRMAPIRRLADVIIDTTKFN